MGVEEEVGINVGQSYSDSPRESRRGLSLASIKQRLSLDGLGAWTRDAIGRGGKGFSTRVSCFLRGKLSSAIYCM